jgi:hypothetical protein
MGLLYIGVPLFILLKQDVPLIGQQTNEDFEMLLHCLDFILNHRIGTFQISHQANLKVAY